LCVTFVGYGTAQLSHTMLSERDLDYNPAADYGRAFGSLASALSFLTAAYSMKTKKHVLWSALAAVFAAATWIVVFNSVWSTASPIFYAFPVATALYFGIMYASLDLYDLEIDFALWRGAKYNYKDA